MHVTCYIILWYVGMAPAVLELEKKNIRRNKKQNWLLEDLISYWLGYD